MHALATGSTGAFGLAGSAEPPLSPVTVGRAPSNFEAPPVPVVSIDELVKLKATTEMAPSPAATPALVPPAAPAGPPAHAPEPPPVAVAPAAPTATRRVVVRLVHGEELELGAYDDAGAAQAHAQQLARRLATAEAEGEWPEIAGRHLRPAAIVSVDVLVEEG